MEPVEISRASPPGRAGPVVRPEAITASTHPPVSPTGGGDEDAAVASPSALRPRGQSASGIVRAGQPSLPALPRQATAGVGPAQSGVPSTDMVRPRSKALHSPRGHAPARPPQAAGTTGARWFSATKQAFVERWDPAAPPAEHTPVEDLFEVARVYASRHGIDLWFGGRPASDAGRPQGEPLLALDPADAAAQLLALRDVARESGRAIGYVHTNEQVGWTVKGVRSGPAHSDAYLVTPFGSIVNLLDIGRMLSCDMTGDELVQGGADVLNCSLSRFLDTTAEQRLGQFKMLTGPQAEGAQGCGSLALVNIKEHLKDGGAQLLRQTLVVRLPHGANGRGTGFMLPSPLAVRYSQSTLYLDLLRAMVASDDDHVDVPSNRGTRRIQTLAGLLRSGATCSTIDGRLLDDLETFRSDWIRALDEEALPRRARLDAPVRPGASDAPGTGTVNLYLDSLVARHQRIAASVRGDDPDCNERRVEGGTPRLNEPRAEQRTASGAGRFMLGGSDTEDDEDDGLVWR